MFKVNHMYAICYMITCNHMMICYHMPYVIWSNAMLSYNHISYVVIWSYAMCISWKASYWIMMYDLDVDVLSFRGPPCSGLNSGHVVPINLVSSLNFSIPYHACLVGCNHSSYLYIHCITRQCRALLFSSLKLGSPFLHRCRMGSGGAWEDKCGTRMHLSSRMRAPSAETPIGFLPQGLLVDIWMSYECCRWALTQPPGAPDNV